MIDRIAKDFFSMKRNPEKLSELPIMLKEFERRQVLARRCPKIILSHLYHRSWFFNVCLKPPNMLHYRSFHPIIVTIAPLNCEQKVFQKREDESNLYCNKNNSWADSRLLAVQSMVPARSSIHPGIREIRATVIVMVHPLLST